MATYTHPISRAHIDSLSITYDEPNQDIDAQFVTLTLPSPLKDGRTLSHFHSYLKQAVEEDGLTVLSLRYSDAYEMRVPVRSGLPVSQVAVVIAKAFDAWIASSNHLNIASVYLDGDLVTIDIDMVGLPENTSNGSLLMAINGHLGRTLPFYWPNSARFKGNRIMANIDADDPTLSAASIAKFAQEAINQSVKQVETADGTEGPATQIGTTEVRVIQQMTGTHAYGVYARFWAGCDLTKGQCRSLQEHLQACLPGLVVNEPVKLTKGSGRGLYRIQGSTSTSSLNWVMKELRLRIDEWLKKLHDLISPAEPAAPARCKLVTQTTHSPAEPTVTTRYLQVEIDPSMTDEQVKACQAAIEAALPAQETLQ